MPVRRALEGIGGSRKSTACDVAGHTCEGVRACVTGATSIARASGPYGGHGDGPMIPLHPKKLLLTKWTAINPLAKNKHFLVSKVIEPELPEVKIEWIEVEAVFSKVVSRIHWRELQDEKLWRRGW